MDRDTAVQRINDGLGFAAPGNTREPKIILRLQEAQRDLEHGKTLPRFLLQEDQPLLLPAGSHAVPLPIGFIREDDDNRLHFFPPGSTLPQYLSPKRYHDAVVANIKVQDKPRGPSVYVIRNSTIDFINVADRDYNLVWNYYKAGAKLDTNIENEWLVNENVPEWLIGEAGYRIAKDVRDADAMTLFDGMRTQGRAAVFGDILADEDAAGPIMMGANM